jgi:aromatic amino acid aminotransferase I / 2-aminoadipate transaminase
LYQTTGFERKKAIYDICVEYGAPLHPLGAFDLDNPTSWSQDLIIAEDDPYFILQLGEYVPKSQRSVECEPTEGEDVARFVASLVPSYLRIDTQGRVLRMDTFSKVASLHSL